MCAIGVVVVANVIGGISDAANGRTYSDTLGDAQQKFGDGTKVVKIDVDGGGVEYDVLSADNSMILIRNHKRTSEAGFPHSGSTATLQGSTWTIGSGASPFDKYQANFDGSGFRQTQSKSDVFGGSTNAKG
jgi:hypothetical protein